MDTWTSNRELPWWRGRSGERHREEDEKREKRNVGWGRLGKARKGGQVGGERRERRSEQEGGGRGEGEGKSGRSAWSLQSG